MEVFKIQVDKLEHFNGHLREVTSEIADTVQSLNSSLASAMGPVINELQNLRKSLVFTLCGMFIVALGTLSLILIFIVSAQSGTHITSEKTKDGWRHELTTDPQKQN